MSAHAIIRIGLILATDAMNTNASQGWTMTDDDIQQLALSLRAFTEDERHKRMNEIRQQHGWWVAEQVRKVIEARNRA